MKLIKRSTLTIQQNYQMTIEQKYLLTFISGKDLWLMKHITCRMDYLINEQAEMIMIMIHVVHWHWQPAMEIHV